MKKGILCLLFFTFAMLLIVSVGCCNGKRVLRVADRQDIRFSRMIDEIKGSPLIFIGEEHDRMEDHWQQVKVIKELNRTGIRLAIGLEMFTAENQYDLDSWTDGRISEEEFIKRFNANWRVPWTYYRPIFIYAREHSIPMVGLNIPREITRKVAKMGFAALTATERGRIPGEITCRVDAGYMALIRRAFAEHGLSEESFIRFCEAQLLWNRTMAWNTVDYLGRHHGITMVVLAGKGHAMKPAIPGEIRNISEVKFSVLLPEDEMFSRDRVSEEDTDYLFGK